MCGEHKKFLGRVNTGDKLYCTKCQSKITKEYGSDYWKQCSFGEFFESWSEEIRDKRKRKSVTSNMLTGWKEVIRQMEEEENNEK